MRLVMTTTSAPTMDVGIMPQPLKPIMIRTKSLEARLEKLQAEGRKDDVVTFEQLGVDLSLIHI